MATFIGFGSGYSQRHHTDTKSPFCPSWATLQTANLVRSPVTLQDIENDIRLYGSFPDPGMPTDPLFHQVVREAFDVWRLATPVKPIHLNDLPDMELATASSSPGIPWKEKGYKTKRDVLKDAAAFDSIRRFWHRVKFGRRKVSPPDCAAFLRAHLVEKGERKVRAVWGYPATIGFQEACFALPIIEALKTQRSTPIAYGLETAKGGCAKIHKLMANGRWFLGSDYKSFDKTVPAWLIRIAFDILLMNLDLTAYQGRGVPDTNALLRVWNYLVNYFIRTPIRMCNGKRFRKSAGVASGSYFTQLVDSIVNWIATTYALRACGHTPLHTIVMGDDSLVALTEQVNMERFDAKIQECGLILNTRKTILVDQLSEMTFLGYKISNGTPLKPEHEFWAALVFPETRDKNYAEYATRAMGLLLATFGQYQTFYDLVSATVREPFDPVVKPGLRRYLAVLGFDHIPRAPPIIQQLEMLAYRD